ncbi:hypothetical protein DN525_04355, partial [Burkholderia multivorans]
MHGAPFSLMARAPPVDLSIISRWTTGKRTRSLSCDHRCATDPLFDALPRRASRHAFPPPQPG